ncbi:class I SAM-dependent methyltransferase [Fundidesulfovibrio terrae]|uniref:class I SAM-dependent methyltransferase n=1 Tax=Fundidesulfovibrio terrae TaxID=2922866 RepID=UPI001FB00946|nr:class I SAM-dependent methyltransferase [Fundidesulfovibrio terrae]
MLIPDAQDKYQSLINFCHWRKIYQVPGDFVEIGALFGTGTRQLSHYLSRECREKRLFVIDVFDPDFDVTETSGGLNMKALYNEWLAATGAPSQWLLYLCNVHGLSNVHTLRGDSKKVVLPTGAVAFAFIDGNHQADYVQSDFRMVWRKLSPGGVVAFHDYGGDLPLVTKAIDDLAARHAPDIEYKRAVARHSLYFMVKRRACSQSAAA